jgi:FeS assembly SUF system regulator
VFRLSKVTDYGIRILAHLAHDEVSGDTDRCQNAREVAEQLALPLPMVSKVMKSLARAGVLESHRGAKGGFSLTKRPEDLTVASMISSLEGPVALTECALAESLCEHEGTCSVQQPWNVINVAVQNTLATVTLADLIHPGFPSSSSVLTLGTSSSSNPFPQVSD